jgi:hypothetical protein
MVYTCDLLTGNILKISFIQAHAYNLNIHDIIRATMRLWKVILLILI